MKIPNLTQRSVPLIDKNGLMAIEWHDFFDDLINAMNLNLSDDGLAVPLQNSDNIKTLETIKNNGKLIINSDNNKLFININGVYKEIQLV